MKLQDTYMWAAAQNLLSYNKEVTLKSYIIYNVLNSEDVTIFLEGKKVHVMFSFKKRLFSDFSGF